MPQYLISVWHDDTFEVDFTTPTRSDSLRKWERSTKS